MVCARSLNLAILRWIAARGTSTFVVAGSLSLAEPSNRLRLLLVVYLFNIFSVQRKGRLWVAAGCRPPLALNLPIIGND
jgi:hypothetical protein